MSVNRIQIKASVGDKKITLPLGQVFDEVGREQLLEIYDEVELQDNINYIQDYETTRYSPDYGPEYKIYYEFEFWNATASTPAYEMNYNVLGYSNAELAKNATSFVKSFFKFDFFDSPKREQQKLMFSMVMPTNNCSKHDVPVNPLEDPEFYWAQKAIDIALPVYNIYYPAFSGAASPSGVNENYYIQWLKDRELFTATTFYMSCKFFNGKNGKVIRMLNQPAPNPPPGSYNFEDWFYYQIILDIKQGNDNPKYNYKVHVYNSMLGNLGITGTAIGETYLGPIKFYEYRIS